MSQFQNLNLKIYGFKTVSNLRFYIRLNNSPYFLRILRINSEKLVSIMVILRV